MWESARAPVFWVGALPLHQPFLSPHAVTWSRGPLTRRLHGLRTGSGEVLGPQAQLSAFWNIPSLRNLRLSVLRSAARSFTAHRACPLNQLWECGFHCSQSTPVSPCPLHPRPPWIGGVRDQNGAGGPCGFVVPVITTCPCT